MSKAGRKMIKFVLLKICVTFLHEMSKNDSTFVLYFVGLSKIIADVSSDSEKSTSLLKVKCVSFEVSTEGRKTAYMSKCNVNEISRGSLELEGKCSLPHEHNDTVSS